MRIALARLFPGLLSPFAALLLVIPLAPRLGARQGLAPGAFHDRWRWTHFSVEQGLPSGGIRDVLEAGGRAYAATERGLGIYDGWRWKTLGTSVGLPEQPIDDISVDNDGELWVVTGGELYRGTARGFRPVQLPNLPEQARVCSCAHLRDGTHVVEVARSDRTNRFLLRGRDTLTPFHTPSPLPPAGAPLLSSAPDGSLWLYTMAGVQRFDGSRWATILPGARRANGSRGPITFGPEGRAVFGVEEPMSLRGIWSWSGSEAVRLDSSGPSVPVAVALGPDGTVVCQYDTHDVRLWSDGAWQSIDPCPPELLAASQLHFRSNGDLWIATGAGLHLVRLFRQRWAHEQHGGFNDPRDRVNTIATTRSGQLWVGHTAGVEVRDSDGEILPDITLPEPAVVTSIAEDEEGVVWVSSGSTMRGLLGWKDGAWRRLVEDADGNPLPLIHRIRRDSTGTTWLLSLAADPAEPLELAGDVHVLRGGRAFHWKDASVLGNARVYDVLRTADGSLWFATSNGLFRKAGDTWDHWSQSEGLRDPRVFRLQAHRADGVWFAQPASGVGYIEPGQVPVYLPLEARDYIRIWDIAPDGDRLWITTSLGIRLVQLDDSGHAMTSIDGLAGIQAPKAWPILIEKDRILIGTMGAGLYIFDRSPESLPEPRVTPRLIRGEGGDRVEWSVDTFWGEPPPSSVLTRLRIDGGNWSPFRAERSRSLEGLEPGFHIFEVQARAPLGGVGPIATAEWEFRVPFYRRPEFQVPMGLAVLALIALIALHQVRRHQHSVAIRESARRYEGLLEYGSDIVLMCDGEGVIRDANRLARTAFGEEIADSGRRLRELLWEDDPSAVLALSAAFSSHRPVTTRLHARNTEGRSLPVEARLVTVADDQVQVVLRDLTDHESARERGRALEDWAAEVQSFADFGRVAGPVFRELSDRTCSILGHADQARRAIEHENAGPGDTLPHLRTVIAEAERAGRLTEEMLVYLSQTPGTQTAVDLNRLIEDLQRPLSFLSRPSEQLRLELAPVIPLVRTDGAHAGHLILRLAELLTSSTVRAGRVLELRTRTIHLDPAEPLKMILDHLGRQDRVVALELRTSTPRLTQFPLTPLLGDRSEEADPLDPRTATIRGLARATGVGLGGEVDAEGIPRLLVFFPAPTGLLPGTAIAQPPTPDRRTVLIVDDDMGVRHVVSRMLRREGYTCLQAASGEEGLECFEEHAEDLLCAVVDVSMPDLDGIEVRRRILERRPSAHVFLMSGLEESEVSARWRAGDACTLLRKPFPPGDLLEAIENERRTRTESSGAVR